MLSGCHQILHTVHNMQKADHQKDKRNSIEEQHFLIQIKVLYLDLFRIILDDTVGYSGNNLADLICHCDRIRMFFQCNADGPVSFDAKIFLHLFIGHNNAGCSIPVKLIHSCQCSADNCLDLKI